MDDIYNLPFIEKYRPKTLDDIVGNENIIKILKKIVKTGNLGNIILSGTSGIGKTTSILCMANEIMGPDHKDAILQLNASDENGVDIIRNQIKIFAQRKMSLPEGVFKIIILDEIDAMKKDAQNSLRGIMEKYSSTTRFVLGCNYSEKILESIQSRCAILRYNKLFDKDILSRLKYVCEKENILYKNSGLNAIVFTSNGDMRHALNNLQTISTRYKSEEITESMVYTVCDVPQPSIIKKIIDYCLSNDIDNAIKLVFELNEEGFAIVDLIKSFFDTVKYDDTLEEMTKLEILKRIGDTQIKISNGLDTNLQIMGMCANICDIES